MLSRRTSVRAGVAALGVSTLLAIGSAPAFAANEGDYTISAGPCTAIQKIELHYYGSGSGYPVGWHDAQAIDPTRNDAQDPYYCAFRLYDGSTEVGYSPDGSSESAWVYDGPGHHIYGWVGYYYNGTLKSSNVGITN
jgi:hypothetical protein